VLALHTVDGGGINGDQVRPTQFGTFGGQSDTGSEHQQGLAGVNLLKKAFPHLPAGVIFGHGNLSPFTV
jgi:hypothetical protein